MGGARKKWAVSHIWRSQVLPHILSSVPQRRNHWLEVLSWHWAVLELSWRKGSMGRVRLFLFSQIFFQWCAGTFLMDSWTSTNHFHSSVSDCLNSCSSGARTAAVRSWSLFMGQFRVHFQDHFLYICYLMHGVGEILPGLSAYGASVWTKAKWGCNQVSPLLWSWF